MEQYKIYNITDSNEFEITEPLEEFKQLTFTNTSQTAEVTFDLYVKDQYSNPNNAPSIATYYLLRNITIPFGVSLTVGSDEIPYLKENVRKVYMKSHDPSGQLTLIIK